MKIHIWEFRNTNEFSEYFLRQKSEQGHFLTVQMILI